MTSDAQDIYENFEANIGKQYGLRPWNDDLQEGSTSVEMTNASASIVGGFMNLVNGIKEEPADETTPMASIPVATNVKKRKPASAPQLSGPRASQACNGCRKSKDGKCVIETAGEPCERCKKKGIDCVMAENLRKKPRPERGQGGKCTKCNSRKVKCEFDHPEQACKTCRKNRHECIVAGEVLRHWESLIPAPDAAMDLGRTLLPKPAAGL